MKPPKDFGHVAVIYLARGADSDHLSRFKRFLQSYRRFDAGEAHTLMVIFKGFDNSAHLAEGRRIFGALDYYPLFTGDNSFDLGAYFEAAQQVAHQRLCFLNSNTEINGNKWLLKLSSNFVQAQVGLVGATGSFESAPYSDSFPNPHIRSNAFMIFRDLFLELLSKAQFNSKMDLYSIESGPGSLTRQIFDRGLSALLVGRDGRGYTPYWWPYSQTFRQGSQSNLLVHDNITRDFERMTFNEKLQVCRATWGEFLRR